MTSIYPFTRNREKVLSAKRRRKHLAAVFSSTNEENVETDADLEWIENHFRVHRFLLRNEYCNRCSWTYTCDKHALNDIVVSSLPDRFYIHEVDLFKTCLHMIRIRGVSKAVSTLHLMERFPSLIKFPKKMKQNSFESCFWTMVGVIQDIQQTVAEHVDEEERFKVVEKVLKMNKNAIRRLLASRVTVSTEVFEHFLEYEDAMLRVKPVFVKDGAFMWKKNEIIFEKK